MLATGIPYLMGTERLKGSHSMSGYHSFELCYLASVYSNLLITKQPMTFYFKPQPGALKDNILRVQPDILPPGSVRIEQVLINGEPYSDFDPVAMTVKLPTLQEHPLKQRPSWAGTPALETAVNQQLRVQVRLAPTGTLFDTDLSIVDGTAELTLFGNLNEVATPAFKAQLDKIIAANPRRVVLDMKNLQGMCKEAARALSFVREKLSLDKDFYVVGANANVRAALQSVGTWEEFTATDTYDGTKIGKN
ncbi:MAG: STAS domain-containing protein [Ktedonobacteraceae bacterium]|nr:STAS domain-containing protein [Ktedonobacteraceae bacterium]